MECKTLIIELLVISVLIVGIAVTASSSDLLGNNNGVNNEKSEIVSSVAVEENPRKIYGDSANLVTPSDDELLGKYEKSDEQFKRVEIGDKIIYWHQRMIDNAIVEGDYINYQFDKNTKELVKKIIYWRDDLPEHVTPAITKERAESIAGGGSATLYFLSTGPSIFPTKPTPKNPCWVVWETIKTDDYGVYYKITIVDAVNGKILGYGLPPPYTGFSFSGPTSYPWGTDPDTCSGAWTELYQNAESWFNTMGYHTEAVEWPTEAKVKSHIQSTKTAMFYEIAHGDSTVFANGCTAGTNNYDYTYASEIETWMAEYTKMPFTFIGSCGGMCDVGPGTFSNEFRKGFMDDTVTVGYCGMASSPCNTTCWYINAFRWQDATFNYMSQGDRVKGAFDKACNDYPMCVPCMRFAGDENFKVVPVVDRVSGPKPDLVITGVWHEGSKIYYKIKNIGTEKAGSSRTSLTVDGVYKKYDSVRSLGAGEERTESFRYTWTCTGASDEITVCADYKNAVAESNEGNNCKTETLEYDDGNGDKQDLVITDIWHEGSKIYYKIKNIGTEKAGSSRTSLWVDGAFVKDDSVRSLGAGEERTESFRYTWACTEPSDEIKVCADYKNAVAESNEGNNCKTVTWEYDDGNGDKPDLVITDIGHEGSKIYYKIKNIGTEKAGSSRTSLTVDGAFVKDDSVRSLGAGEERTESFRYTWTCTEPSDEIKVCADYKNAVAESNEANNCKTVTLENGGNGDKPDLVITDIWHEGSKIYYKIKNIGTEKAGSSRTSLTVDGAFKKYDSARSLGPGAERTESFRYKWACTNPSYEIKVCADYKNAVAESNEGNNCKTETWDCDGGIEYWAVIAGEGYTCDWADNDAYDMYDGLLSYSDWKAENIRLLVSNAAGTKHDCTRDNIQAGIAWMASRADADDVCLFFYAGHGAHNTDIAPIDEADGWDEYICPEGGNIRDDELDAWMTTPIKGKKVVIIDSCFSGGFVKGEGVRALLGVPYAELTDGFVRDLNKPGYVTLTAADDHEKAYGDLTLNNGVFTYYVVEGLGGPANADADNDISAEETYNYAQPLIVAHTTGWVPNTQHPQLYDGVTGELPVVKW